MLTISLLVLCLRSVASLFDPAVAVGFKALQARSTHIPHHYPENAYFSWDEAAQNLSLVPAVDASDKPISVFHKNSDGSWIEDRLSKYLQRGRQVVHKVFLRTTPPRTLEVVAKKGVVVYEAE